MKIIKNISGNLEKLKNEQEKNVDGFGFQENLAEIGEAKKEDSVLFSENEKDLRKKIESIKLNGNLSRQAQVNADDAKLLDGQKKIKRLLQLASQKGVIYAVNVAKKINDPYVLDALHDTLAKEGHYKEFIK